MNGYINLPEIGMSDPSNTNPSNPSAGGNTKIQPSNTPAHPTEQVGYGYMTSDSKMKIDGFAPSGENSSGIPAAQPINPITFGDPNDSSVDFRDGMSIDTIDIAGKNDYVKRGFDTAI